MTQLLVIRRGLSAVRAIRAVFNEAIISRGLLLSRATHELGCAFFLSLGELEAKSLRK
jgi:hypothetical protein